MQVRPQVYAGGLATKAGPGMPLMEQLSPAYNATAAGTTLTANELLSGWLIRSNGGGAIYTDVLPTTDSIISALLASGAAPQVGDCLRFIFQNTIAYAATITLGSGMVAGSGTVTAVAASVTRIFFLTLLATKPTVTLPGVTTTSGNKILSNISAADLAKIMPGMAVTGTGIGASALVVGVAPDAGTCTVDVNSTASADNIAVTFAPRLRIDSIGVLGLTT